MMIIRCPNNTCNTKMSLNIKVIENQKANVKCPSCKQFFKPFEILTEEQKQQIEREANRKKEEPEIEEKKAVGWLVVHDEKTHAQTFDLFDGVQVIGKKSAAKPCDIMIEIDDPYLSRNHFSINVKTAGSRSTFLLKDNQSANGTFVETTLIGNFEKQLRRLREGEEVYIEDGAIIQAGDTKIIFKSTDSSQNKSMAQQAVQSQDIPKTVIL